MNDAYLHLLINELPVVGVLIGTILLVIGLIMRNLTLKRTSLIIFLASGIITIPSYISGNSAVNSLDGLRQLDDTYITQHRQAAFEFTRMICALCVMALITLILDIRKNLNASKAFYIITLAGAIFMFLLTQHIGFTGRQISHPELRDNLFQDPE